MESNPISVGSAKKPIVIQALETNVKENARTKQIKWNRIKAGHLCDMSFGQIVNLI